jgi:predicted nucleotidyltransferase
MRRTRDPRAVFFSRRLRQRLKGVRRVILFGSRARGDAREGSDYDFAVVVKSRTAEAVSAVRNTELEFLDRYDTLSSSLVFNESE